MVCPVPLLHRLQMQYLLYPRIFHLKSFQDLNKRTLTAPTLHCNNSSALATLQLQSSRLFYDRVMHSTNWILHHYKWVRAIVRRHRLASSSSSSTNIEHVYLLLRCNCHRHHIMPSSLNGDGGRWWWWRCCLVLYFLLSCWCCCCHCLASLSE